ncbi:LapA family protein [Bacillus horti]|uniref:Integral membrane protein n=1 Tax=Caldalkalibacillus horti TaxID=77523 RepID=A0ABT9VTM9_9BACI|nr:lipopolysaccharide assembly protein LapA domain-containing protein [Bacillus horti]MDQ0164240.1 putative integral membrane protein [Bacillus horti]
MKGQKTLILALVFALIVAIFSVLNVEAVAVNVLFTTAFIPLIIVILASTLMGGLIIGAVGMFRQYSLHKENKILKKAVTDHFGQEYLETLLQRKNKNGEEGGTTQRYSSPNSKRHVNQVAQPKEQQHKSPDLNKDSAANQKQSSEKK